MLNNVVLVGRLTRDPETRSTTSGMTVASFTIASDERRGGQKTTIFMPVSVFGKQADVVSKFTHKGSLVGVVGRLTQRKYTRRDSNVEVTSTEIVAERIELMEPKASNGVSENDSGYTPDVGSSYNAPDNSVKPQGTPSTSNNLDPLMEDDLPF